MKIIINRLPNKFYSNNKQVIIRFLHLGEERTNSLIKKVLEMDENAAEKTLMYTLREFSKRHRNLTQKFIKHYRKSLDIIGKKPPELEQLSMTKKLLIGSYFSMEYSISAAAFFNPSIVDSPDQTGLEEGSKRIIVSFRATGEGHISSIVFQTGVINYLGEMQFEKAGYHVDEAEVVKRHIYNKERFMVKLHEMEVDENVIKPVMDSVKDEFIYGELLKSVNEYLAHNSSLEEEKQRAIKQIIWLADSHYKLLFSRDTHISERVIYPTSYTERKGIEDARFVKFINDDGEVTYFATYSAYDGYTALQKLIVTKDFYTFEIKPLHGDGIQNKNLALFPRKIDGKYVMLSRIDGVNSFIAFSENLNVWPEPVKIQEPEFPWEFIQIGNCGSPIETEQGWLVITHGVGPMRQYALGATLLDLKDPTKEIGRLKEPLLVPNDEEREGYVPNVVYSCGSIIHNDKLIVPYGLSDTGSGFMSVCVRKLLDKILTN